MSLLDGIRSLLFGKRGASVEQRVVRGFPVVVPRRLLRRDAHLHDGAHLSGPHGHHGRAGGLVNSA
ncbi:MAG TPA: hypothetical protein VM033_04255 [Gemmatimonadaceae bacterium]|nr:hypothetical protein [Gemmatimonadaceae bacterium]